MNYISGTNCLTECPDATPYHNKATKQCILSCTGEYKYLKEADNSCNRREDCNFYGVDSNSNYLCYDNCPNYSEYGTNKCLDNCDSNQYRGNEAPYNNICFSSCKEIPGGEYIYEGMINSNKNVLFFEKLEDAVIKAKEITKKGSACILSPAASSYGYFKNFEERGRLYKKYVTSNN